MIQRQLRLIEEVEFDVNEVLGQVAEYLLKSESPLPNEKSSITPPTAQNNDENTETLNYSMSGKRTGLKGVEIPSFDGKPDKWPYFWGNISLTKAKVWEDMAKFGPYMTHMWA